MYIYLSFVLFIVVIIGYRYYIVSQELHKKNQAFLKLKTDYESLQNIRLKLKTVNKDILKKHEELLFAHRDILNQSLATEDVNVELLQTQEELMAQKEFMEKQNQELERQTMRLKANEGILEKSVEKIKRSEAEIKLQKIELEEKNAEILTQNEELRQTQEELMAQKEFMEKQNQELERQRKILKANEGILQKSVEKIKRSEAEIKLQKIELEEKNTEVLTQNEELRQTQEELTAQKEFMEKQNQELEKQKKILKANEGILQKAIEKIKRSETEIKLQKIELEERNAEILTQNEELYQTQEELMTQREFIEKQNAELQHSNSKIRNSIHAALIIQEAILPYESKMQELLREYFVLYKPKDIVSGDFWWLNQVGDRIYLVCVDCTGHGVAGAFMTMIGNTLLDKIIRLRGIESPAEILNTMHEEIQVVLRQNETRNNNGMDMSLLCWQQKGDIVDLCFAGAKQSMYYIKAGEEELFELKGDRKAIGGSQNEAKRFTNQSLRLKKGSWIYLGSDGLPDQNNPNRKRLGEKLLKEILTENNHLSAAEQKCLLEKTLADHQGSSEQRDDILWIGVEL